MAEIDPDLLREPDPDEKRARKKVMDAAKARDGERLEEIRQAVLEGSLCIDDVDEDYILGEWMVYSGAGTYVTPGNPAYDKNRASILAERLAQIPGTPEYRTAQVQAADAEATRLAQKAGEENAERFGRERDIEVTRVKRLQGRCIHCGSLRFTVKAQSSRDTWDRMRREGKFDPASTSFVFECGLCRLSWEWDRSASDSPPRPSESVLLAALQREMLKEHLTGTGRNLESEHISATMDHPYERHDRTIVEELFVEPEEVDFAWGRSVVMNLLGGFASEVKCQFVATSQNGRKNYVSGLFHKEAHIAFEELSGDFRRQAQRTLDDLERHILTDGWRRTDSGGPWCRRKYIRERTG